MVRIGRRQYLRNMSGNVKSHWVLQFISERLLNCRTWWHQASGSGYMGLLRSRLRRRTPSVYSATSQPFSACICRREYYLLGNLPESLRLLRTYSLYVYIFRTRYIHAACGMVSSSMGWYPRPWSSWHLQGASLHLKP